MKECNNDNDSDSEPGKEMDYVHSVKSEEDDFEFYEKVPEVTECSLGILTLNLNQNT